MCFTLQNKLIILACLVVAITAQGKANIFFLDFLNYTRHLHNYNPMYFILIYLLVHLPKTLDEENISVLYNY